MFSFLRRRISTETPQTTRTYPLKTTRVKIFIITYKNEEYINGVLRSIYTSNTPPSEFANISVTVINNHSKFAVAEEFKTVQVLHNMCRPDFSTGHLSRSWNQAIVHGFKNLQNPDCDILITLQDDVIVKPDFLTKLLSAHEKYDFISSGCGDALCSYAPDAIRKVGLWDERFCNIGYQEADYFLRSIIYNRERTSINDSTHGRSWQPIGKDQVLPYNEVRFDSESKEDRLDSEFISIPYTNADRKNDARASMNFHTVSETIFEKKWKIAPSPWIPQHFKISKPRIESYVYYPYFESGVMGLKQKGYLVPTGRHLGFDL